MKGPEKKEWNADGKKNGALRVCHFPQVPCKPFHVPVASIKEAIKIMDVLAYYDGFQLNNRIKPDYCNSSSVEVWDEEAKEWTGWVDEETGCDNPRDLSEAKREARAA
jgi:hypothetical protein